ncbi:MAG TPA: solute carrier family 23 protein [Oscillospiraceae bacterium]|nr:solute carrier family 23 protein [Oscillospiraceae bacterium]HQQ89013.1 solute carrier family 23 protein [Oscillospiraceae bacterium]HRW56238.1 solute carrier family 23 protein [Oscillospiraceae bacterium]
MNLIYDVGDKPKLSKTLIFAFQQMIAIMAATLLVPILITGFGLPADPAAALFGAGIGTLVYIFFSKKKSPVFLGSSFTFLGAYAASINQLYGYWGIIIGVVFAGLVYVVIALIIKKVGSDWVNRLMPPAIIGPIVTLIGLSLSSTATGWMSANGGGTYNLVSILCGLVTFFTIVLVSVKGSKTLKLIPFIIGVGAGYGLALVFTIIGNAAGIESLKLLSFQPFIDTFGNLSLTSFIDYPKFFFLKGIETNGQYPLDIAAIGNIAMIYVPIGVVELAQHIADHKNLGSIINKDLITDPGLDNTLLGDGVGSMVGALFGGCANTTYGESIGCVAITRNASIVSIIDASLGCMILSFFTPFVTVINSIPKCVMGGACVALYGFIAVSGLQMLHKVNLGDNRNLFVVSAILVTGIGGLTLEFGQNPVTGGSLFSITSLAVALICGLLTSLIVNNGKIGTGTNEEDGLSAAAEEMGKVDFSKINEDKK